MGDKDLYAQILGIGSPWRVAAVDLRLLESSVAVVPGALKRGLGRAGKHRATRLKRLFPRHVL